MKILIIGAGKMGLAITRQLADEGHDITVIDSDGEKIQTVSDMYDVITLQGNGESFEVLRTAGVEDVDLLIAASGDDAVNLVCSVAGRYLGAKEAVIRVKDPEFSREREMLSKGFGVSASFNPDLETAREIARILQFPMAARVETFASGRSELVEYRIDAESSLHGVPMKELRNRFHAQVLICAVERDGAVFIPKGDFVLLSGDRISIAGSRTELRNFFRAVGKDRKSVRNVILMGGSLIALYLSRELIRAGMDVTIIEQNRSRCEELCTLLPDATIICGDGSKEEVLLEEGIRNADAFVSLTGSDEDNIIVSMYAADMGVGKVICKLSDDHFVNMLQKSVLDTFVCPKLLAASELARYVRALHNAQGSSVESLYRLIDNQVEALEFAVGADSAVVGTPLMNLKIAPDVLIAAVLHGHEVSIPGGNTVIHEDDHAVLVTTRKGLRSLDDILG